MPLIAREHSFTPDSADYFARVLADQPELLQSLRQDQPGRRIIEGHFNARPIAILVAEAAGDGWQVTALAVHPANRGRSVGSTLLAGAAGLLPDLAWPDSLTGVAARAGLV
ncbi:hypothetical protein [Isoalcanivorax beigongshangi]|uniref:GNAT family N-acetyltransferase n=1 Tax=Isoalcanivorax beigongshangi TaxID=3238810 RepID=A0ABV4AJX1_9GAMM